MNVRMGNPFEPPSASLDIAGAPDPAIAKKIRNAWIAGIVSAALTLWLVVLALMGAAAPGITPLSIIDVIIGLGLSYGIAHKSRACAVLLLVFFILNKVFFWLLSRDVAELPLAIVLTWFFAQGVVGTFQYHQAKVGAKVAA